MNSPIAISLRKARELVRPIGVVITEHGKAYKAKLPLSNADGSARFLYSADLNSLVGQAAIETAKQCHENITRCRDVFIEGDVFLSFPVVPTVAASAPAAPEGEAEDSSDV